MCSLISRGNVNEMRSAEELSRRSPALGQECSAQQPLCSQAHPTRLAGLGQAGQLGCAYKELSKPGSAGGALEVQAEAPTDGSGMLLGCLSLRLN